MNRYIVTDDGVIVDRWLAEDQYPAEVARREMTDRTLRWLNRNDIWTAAVQRGVKP